MNFNYIMDNPKYYYRSVINSIYELKEDDKKPIIEREQLKPYIDDANNMPTTLWFTKTQKESDRPMLNSLIVAGQATVCYNLIQYITKVKSNKELYALLDDAYKTGLDDFEKDLTANFEAFKNKPEWLLKQFLG